MNDVYEFRRAPGKGAIWLAAIAVVLLLTAIVINGAEQFMWLVWVFGGVTITWMVMPKPALGVRIDDDFLIMSAWTAPRPIPLDQIAHIRAAETRIETIYTLVYRDGEEEILFSGDLPDVETLSRVLALRGVPVRDLDY